MKTQFFKNMNNIDKRVCLDMKKTYGGRIHNYFLSNEYPKIRFGIYRHGMFHLLRDICSQTGKILFDIHTEDLKQKQLNKGL